MEYANHLNDYAPAPTSDEVAQAVSAAMQATGKNCTTEVYRFLLSAIDLTTLSCTDSEQSVAAMARRAAEFDIDYPHLQNVASICVYPPFVETAGLAIPFNGCGMSCNFWFPQAIPNIWRKKFPIPTDAISCRHSPDWAHPIGMLTQGAPWWA